MGWPDGAAQHNVGYKTETHTELWISSPIFTRLLIGNTRVPCPKEASWYCQRTTQGPLNLMLHSSSSTTFLYQKKKLLDEISDVMLFWVSFPNCVSTRIKTYYITGHLEVVLWQEKHGIVLEWSTAVVQWGMLNMWGAAVQHIRIFTYCWFVLLGWCLLYWCLQLTKWLRPVQCHYLPSWDIGKTLMY